MATAPKGVVRRQILAYVEKRDAPPTEANPSQFIVESVVVWILQSVWSYFSLDLIYIHILGQT
jgi:hypothetical protein